MIEYISSADFVCDYASELEGLEHKQSFISAFVDVFSTYKSLYEHSNKIVLTTKDELETTLLESADNLLKSSEKNTFKYYCLAMDFLNSLQDIAEVIYDSNGFEVEIKVQLDNKTTEFIVVTDPIAFYIRTRNN